MNFYREELITQGGGLVNYAFHEEAKMDLSLVSGPSVWDLSLEKLFGKISQGAISNYPNPPESRELLSGLADFEDVPESWMMLTPGADIAIEMVYRQFLGVKNTAGVIIPTFPRFEIVLSTLPMVETRFYNKLEDITESLDLLCLCTPNNPTTEQLNQERLIEKIQEFPDCLFCIDSVFERYGDYSVIEMAKKHKNVVVLKSFSKLGLAGLRLGYIISHPDNINYLRIGQSPFPVPMLIQEAGVQILKQKEKLEIFDKKVEISHDQIRSELGDLVIRESRVPFYLLKTKIGSEEAEKLLFEDGISVVGGYKFKGLNPNRLRIALGTKSENEYLVDCLAKRAII